VTKLKLDAAAEQIETAVRNHNPELIARGQVPRRTNLHTGGSPTWQRLATESQRLMMHAETREAIESLGYDMDECLGRETPTQPLAEGLTVEFSDDPVGTVYVKPAGAASGLWDRLGPAAGSVSLPAGVAVKLALAPGRRRYREALAGLPPGWLHGLCMAQVAVDPKPELEGLPLLDGLRELDLAYTRTAPGALGWLAGLDDLTGVSLLGTAITAQDLEAVVTSPAQRERFLLEMVTTE
jgi:hypothetical protein